MPIAYSIGAFAKAAGVPITTVRFYERRGLLVPAARSRSHYRVYGQSSLERLRFIRAAQAIGFTLEDIAALLELRDTAGAGQCKSKVLPMITRRLADVDRRMTDLQRVRTFLSDAAAACTAAAQDCCPVMDMLNTGKTPGCA